jgi:hypothetical protein
MSQRDAGTRSIAPEYRAPHVALSLAAQSAFEQTALQGQALNLAIACQVFREVH